MENRQLSPPLSSPNAVSEVAYGEGLSSSPLPPQSVDSRDGKKLKKPPTITPRSFRRFFTPRRTLGKPAKVSAARKALCEITSPAINRGGQDRGRGDAELEGFADIVASGKENESLSMFAGRKKRRLLLSPDTSPDQSPVKKSKATSKNEEIKSTVESLDQVLTREQGKAEEQDKAANAVKQSYTEQQRLSKRQEQQDDGDDSEYDNSNVSVMVTIPSPVRRARPLGSTGRILERSMGTGRSTGTRRSAGHCTGTSKKVDKLLVQLIDDVQIGKMKRQGFTAGHKILMCAPMAAHPKVPFRSASQAVIVSACKLGHVKKA